MDSNNYIKLLKNTLKYDIQEHNLQCVINDLRESKVVTYKETDNEDIISINSKDDKSKRIIDCLTQPERVASFIEKMFINKGYRYSIYFKCDEFALNENKVNYNSLDDFLPMAFIKTKDLSKPILINEKESIIFKFSKIIDPFYSEIESIRSVFYPTLWIYHKELKILEHRFDLIGFKGKDDFYETTFHAQLQLLKSHFHIKTSEFRSSKTIKYIVDNKKNEVHEISQHMGLKGDSTAKLKAGQNLVMPFIGDLERLLEDNIKLFEKNDDTIKISDLINEYISDVKKNAKYKSRLLYWYDGKNNFLGINILFSYRDKNYDLFNFHNPKNTKMELMNYAIQYIVKVQNDIGSNRRRRTKRVK